MWEYIAINYKIHVCILAGGTRVRLRRCATADWAGTVATFGNMCGGACSSIVSEGVDVGAAGALANAEVSPVTTASLKMRMDTMEPLSLTTETLSVMPTAPDARLTFAGSRGTASAMSAGGAERHRSRRSGQPRAL